MTEHASVSLGGADGTAHAANMQKRAEGRGDDRQTETADPAAALRDGCNATVDGGQGGMLKAFKAFRRRCNVDGNKIEFEPFCTGLGLMNIRLSPPNMKAFFDSIDTDGTGEIDISKFAANVLGQRVGANVSLGGADGTSHAQRQARRRPPTPSPTHAFALHLTPRQVDVHLLHAGAGRKPPF